MQEIERKFLVDCTKWAPREKGKKIKQGYLSVDPERTVRVRISGEDAFLTIKGKTKGITRTELEYNIPITEAEVLLSLCLEFVIEKTRYIEEYENLIWEIDVFHGKNEGLVLAEVELESETQYVKLPKWVKKEVSGEPRYYNSHMSQKPFSSW